MAYNDLTNTERAKKYYRGISANEFAPRTDLRGKKFGRLTVIDFDHKIMQDKCFAKLDGVLSI